MDVSTMAMQQKMPGTPISNEAVAPRYKRTEAGVIPDDWQVRPMLDAVALAKGQVDPRRPPYSTMILVAPDHIESGTGRLLVQVTAVDQGAISGKYRFASGDVVYSKIRPYLRKAFLADFSGLCSADMYPLTPAADVTPRFVLDVLLGHHFSKFAEAVSVRSGIPKINREELAQYFIALPLPPEQRAIAAALSDADRLIGALDALIAKKRAVKLAAMQQLLTGKTRLPGFRGEWETKALGEIADIRVGRTPSRANQAFWGRGNMWLAISDLRSKWIYSTAEEITDLASSTMTAIPAKTLIMSFKLSIGRLAFTGTEMYSNEAICSLNNLKGCAEFLYYVLGRVDFSLYGKQAVKGHTLNQDSLRQILVPHPNVEEQHAIATVLSDMDAEIEMLERRLEKTKAIKQGMMQVLLTGRVRLVAPAEEAEA